MAKAASRINSSIIHHSKYICNGCKHFKRLFLSINASVFFPNNQALYSCTRDFLRMIFTNDFFTRESIRRSDKINECTKSNRNFGRLPSGNVLIVFENLADGKPSFTLHVGCLSFCVFLSSLFFCVFLSSLSFKKGAFYLFCSPFTSLVECVESFEM